MRRAALVGLCLAAAGMAGCETYEGRDAYDSGPYATAGLYGGYDYQGQDYDRLGNDCAYFDGSGAGLLDPWLACTDEGREVVRHGFDRDEDRVISDELADQANIWFRRHADTDRDMRLTDPEIRAALVNAARHHDVMGD
ncbi:hypothetical protein [Sphingosinicella rhizophila]|uniref:Uncharacterized protein n=1 Tax=Sphingosinicella rhizophila TaxID=3050082 RepID=A0ABU3Q2S4_9SPHN|nr:hypothetical protein [Sphingosinicella sp. GR2756]MDT9597711.1 hypothetical protein [Sphingosinicella sp. GR2756]